ncbi:MAG TPA: hypothetical protein PLI09_21295, partial [Candidatus Hydrogenedentes bacterium]|nr:hypothetical protein [Candidatus Hydrogenedentota bacterium]
MRTLFSETHQIKRISFFILAAVLFSVGINAFGAEDKDYYALQPYIVDRPSQDLIAPTPPSGQSCILTFNTDAMTLQTSGPGVEPYGTYNDRVVNVKGVAVYYFRNVRIDSGVSIQVLGSKPLSISADRDMYIASSIDVSGAVGLRAGSGTGGAGAIGAGGGGAGGTGSGGGGVGGAGGTGGVGGGGWFGDNGQPGYDGYDAPTNEQGTSGYRGANGNYGASGNTGGNGIGGLNNGNAGQGGNGGIGGRTPDGVTLGGTGGAPCLNNGGGGSGGGATWWSGGDGGAGGGASGAGGNGATGTVGNAGSPGSSGANAIFSDAHVNDLEIAAGAGGGGGGQGGGGQGGGQGGGG